MSKFLFFLVREGNSGTEESEGHEAEMHTASDIGIPKKKVRKLVKLVLLIKVEILSEKVY